MHNLFSYERFARRLVLKQRHKRTQKWPIGVLLSHLSLLYHYRDGLKLNFHLWWVVFRFLMILKLSFGFQRHMPQWPPPPVTVYVTITHHQGQDLFKCYFSHFEGVFS